MAAQHIDTMEWGDASVQGVLQDWWRQALHRDSDFIHANACTDIHDYMIKKSATLSPQSVDLASLVMLSTTMVAQVNASHASSGQTAHITRRRP